MIFFFFFRFHIPFKECSSIGTPTSFANDTFKIFPLAVTLENTMLQNMVLSLHWWGISGILLGGKHGTAWGHFIKSQFASGSLRSTWVFWNPQEYHLLTRWNYPSVAPRGRNGIWQRGVGNLDLRIVSWWWTGRPGMLRFMGSRRVRHDWATELNWIELIVSQCGVLRVQDFLYLYISSPDSILS